MAFMSKSGQGFSNKPAARRADRMAETQKPAPQAQKPSRKSVTIYHDGQKFHSSGGSGGDQEHNDIESALERARSIFGGSEAGSEDTAMKASGAGGAL